MTKFNPLLHTAVASITYGRKQSIVLSRSAFRRVVMNVLHTQCHEPKLRMSRQASDFLQEQAEQMLHDLFVSTQKVADHCSTRQISNRHMRFACFLTQTGVCPKPVPDNPVGDNFYTEYVSDSPGVGCVDQSYQLAAERHKLKV
jgi:histone H3/H4